MRLLTVAFALALLGAMVFILSMTGQSTLIAAQSVSPTMPAVLAQAR